MRLTVYSDYALRMLMYLALKPDQLSTIADIAASYDISENHLMKVAHQLGVGGFVETVRGRGGGLRLGTGCLFLARHRSSLGGATVVSLYLQSRYGMRAGKVQMMIDGTVVLLALFIVPVERVAYSVLAVLVMSGFLWISHRPGRYTAE